MKISFIEYVRLRLDSHDRMREVGMRTDRWPPGHCPEWEPWKTKTYKPPVWTPFQKELLTTFCINEKLTHRSHSDLMIYVEVTFT